MSESRFQDKEHCSKMAVLYKIASTKWLLKLSKFSKLNLQKSHIVNSVYWKQLIKLGLESGTPIWGAGISGGS